MLRLELGQGKYTYILHDDGRQEALRYGEPWRDLVGDNLVFHLGSTIETLQARVKELEAKPAGNILDWNVIGEAMKRAGLPGDIAPLETESQFIARIIDDLTNMAQLAADGGPGEETMQDAIDRVVMQCGGDQWRSCSQYPREEWQLEAENGDTNLGYWEWVIHQAEADEADLATLTAAT